MRGGVAGSRDGRVGRAARAAACVALALFLLLASRGEARAQALRVDVGGGSSLRVRTGPSTAYAIRGAVYRDQVYVASERRGEWQRIWFDGEAGWSHGAYLDPTAATVGRVTAHRLNVRTGPGTGYRILGTVPGGSAFAVIGASGAWRRIYYAGGTAWVHGSYLDAGAGAPAAAPAPTPAPGAPSAAGFIQLPAAGPGFYSYSPAGDRWGTQALVYGLLRVGQQWAATGWPRIGIGDVSLRNGGPMAGHASHRRGVDADIRPVRTDGEGPVTRFESSYSRSRTTALAQALDRQFSIVYLFFNDARVPGTTPWPNHDNHLHLRIR